VCVQRRSFSDGHETLHTLGWRGRRAHVIHTDVESSQSGRANRARPKVEDEVVSGEQGLLQAAAELPPRPKQTEYVRAENVPANCDCRPAAALASSPYVSVSSPSEEDAKLIIAEDFRRFDGVEHQAHSQRGCHRASCGMTKESRTSRRATI
jgi:hypothetical protein